MRKTVKVNYSGFWKELNPEDNLFYQILSQRYNVQISETPDFLFCGPLGKPLEYMKFENCVRILFTGEPLPPSFALFDYAIAFDYLEFGDRYIRYPYSIWNYKGEKKFRKTYTEEEAVEILKNKSVFCNFIYSHYSEWSRRDELFHALSGYKFVDSAGTYLNNQENSLFVRGESKYEFLKKSKFTIAGESISYPGFVTEKIVHCFENGSIPIYFGDPLVDKMFNAKAFINVNKEDSIKDIVDKVREIDQNDRLYLEMLMEPITTDPEYCHNQYEKLKEFLYNIFDQEPIDAYRRMRHYMGGQYEGFAKEYARIEGSLWYRVGKKLKLI